MTGQYFDSESNLFYNYFRYYDPSTGRYITSDPIGLEGGLNTFGYVGGSPLSYVDSYGLNPLAITAGAGAIGTIGVACQAKNCGKTVVDTAVAVNNTAQNIAILAVATTAVAVKNICNSNDDENKECQKAILNAKSASQRLATKRIPQYLYAYRNGYADAGHYKALIEAQKALRDALRRIDLHCKTKPPEYERWQRQVEKVFPKKH